VKVVTPEELVKNNK